MGGMTAYHLASRFQAVILMAPAIQKIQLFPDKFLSDPDRLVTANV